MVKISRSFIIAVVLLLMTALIAQAGGWAVITLDELPTEIATGQALSIGFTVRQHGKTLRSDLQPLLHFARADTTKSFTVTAKREGASGHYTANLTFPSGGQWNWRIDIEQFGMMTQDMPPLSVGAAAAAAPVNSSTANTLPAAAGLLGLICVGVGLALWLRTRARWVLAFLGAAALIGTGGLIAAVGSTTLATASAQPDRSTLADRGKALFEAKGCVMCHTNAAVHAGVGPFYFGDKPAPDLTHVRLSDEYLRHWLKNPAALKPGTAMPNLDLKSEEIEALIAFLKNE